MAAGAQRERITVAILALGGQGGGVLADWLIAVAQRNGYRAQGTSVPGVAQRTGSTVYYIEMIPEGGAGDNRGEPVLALNPVPGDVDVVIASELMEAGRAILRGFVTEDRTTLVGSTHRIYAISEKSALGDGTASGERILAAARRRARRFVGFDMDAAATRAGSVISSVMLGAVAGSGALPFAHDDYEEAIRAGGKAVAANLKGFARGVADAAGVIEAVEAATRPPAPSSAAGRRLAARIEAELPPAAHPFALEGVRRLMDYQDEAYATAYLDRLTRLTSAAGEVAGTELAVEAARHLALWMAYEDTARVADLKVRASRLERVRSELRVRDGQLMSVTDYFHPRLQEVAESLPRSLGRWLLRDGTVQRWLARRFARGRHVEVTSLRWHLLLTLVAAMRLIRRRSLRFFEEQGRIEAWLAKVAAVAPGDPALAVELLRHQRLIKGYSDTFERGLANYGTVTAASVSLAGRRDASERAQRLREAALKDEDGRALLTELNRQAAS